MRSMYARIVGRSGRRRSQRGQSMVEFCLVLPTLLTLVLAVAEMGFAFGQNMSLELGSREGSRVGASLANGAGTPGGATSVDPQIIASVERALTSKGANVKLSDIEYVRIYKSNATGGQGSFNEWHYSSSPVTTGGVTVHFQQVSSGWSAASRISALPNPDSIGVAIRYRYHLQTPLGAIAGIFGAGEFVMSDSTVMAVEPAG